MYKLFLKRLLDIMLSLLGIIVLSPIFIIAFILIFLGDGFPLFYFQKRVGINGNQFKVLKLRTMKQGMTDLGLTSFEDDPRYFKGSKFLRAFKIDELPQLVNILLGHMSLIGPRPTVMEDYLKMDNEQKARFQVRPGLTGLAQISGNTSLKWPERVKLDILYIKTLSFNRDFKILIKTVTMWVSNKLDSNPPETGEW
jgi:undecaprenyl phosphate N,N'-diacetylbacillosamine 1-phosphate transferase